MRVVVVEISQHLLRVCGYLPHWLQFDWLPAYKAKNKRSQKPDLCLELS